jgi:hypothetical protein
VTSIPGLGGPAPQLQRAMMEMVDKALAEEAELLADGASADAPGEQTGRVAVRGRVPGQTGSGQAAPGQAAGAAPRGVAGALPLAGATGEAIVVELSAKARLAEQLRGPQEATPLGRQAATAPSDPAPAADRADAVPTQQPPATAPAKPSGLGSQVRALPLDQLLAVLKRSGTDFKQAVRILRHIELDQPLPAKGVLQALWAETPVEARPLAAMRAADPPRPAEPDAGPADARPVDAPRRSDPEAVMNAPLDQLLRPRAIVDPGAPTLATVVQDQPVNQVYVAGLTTAEYQRLVMLLGPELPGWFVAVRGAWGLRTLVEHRSIARLATVRLAGVRLGGWAIGAVGMTIAWVAGIRYGAWW